MKIKHIFFSIAIIINAYSLTLENTDGQLVRDLCIILDISGAETTTQNNMLSITFKRFLSSELCPILTNISILNRYLRDMPPHYNLPENSSASTELDKLAETLVKAMHAQETPIDIEMYVIKSWKLISNPFVLIIPKKYKDQHQNNLGFITKSFQKIENIDAYNTWYYQALGYINPLALTPIEVYSNELLNTLEKIMSTNKEFLWNIYAIGHGGQCMLNYIIGIPEDKFKKILEFFNTAVNSKLFTYMSCYAGGIRSRLLFYDEKFISRINFPIIIMGITDLPFGHIESTLQLTQNLQGLPESFSLLDRITISQKNQDKIGNSLSTIFQLAKSYSDNERKSVNFIENLPLIRYSGSNRFSVLPIEGISTSSSIASKNQGETIPIAESALVIDQPYVDKTLELKWSVKIMASIPDQKWIYIKSLIFDKKNGHISGKDFNCSSVECFNEVLASFTSHLNDFETIPLAPKAAQHIYLIDRMKLNGVEYTKAMIFVNISPPFTFNWNNRRHLFFLQNGEGYLFISNPKELYQPKKLSPEETQKYIKLFNEQKAKLNKEYHSKGLKHLIQD